MPWIYVVREDIPSALKKLPSRKDEWTWGKAPQEVAHLRLRSCLEKKDWGKHFQSSFGSVVSCMNMREGWWHILEIPRIIKVRKDLQVHRVQSYILWLEKQLGPVLCKRISECSLNSLDTCQPNYMTNHCLIEAPLTFFLQVSHLPTNFLLQWSPSYCRAQRSFQALVR